jgi:hypothetical protein
MSGWGKGGVATEVAALHSLPVAGHRLQHVAPAVGAVPRHRVELRGRTGVGGEAHADSC